MGVRPDRETPVPKARLEGLLCKVLSSSESATSKTIKPNGGRKISPRAMKSEMQRPGMHHPREILFPFIANCMEKSRVTPKKTCPHVIALKKSMDHQQEPSHPVFHTRSSAQIWPQQAATSAWSSP